MASAHSTPQHNAPTHTCHKTANPHPSLPAVPVHRRTGSAAGGVGRWYRRSGCCRVAAQEGLSGLQGQACQGRVHLQQRGCPSRRPRHRASHPLRQARLLTAPEPAGCAAVAPPAPAASCAAALLAASVAVRHTPSPGAAVACGHPAVHAVRLHLDMTARLQSLPADPSWVHPHPPPHHRTNRHRCRLPPAAAALTAADCCTARPRSAGLHPTELLSLVRIRAAGYWPR